MRTFFISLLLVTCALWVQHLYTKGDPQLDILISKQKTMDLIHTETFTDWRTPSLHMNILSVFWAEQTDHVHTAKQRFAEDLQTFLPDYGIWISRQRKNSVLGIGYTRGITIPTAELPQKLKQDRQLGAEPCQTAKIQTLSLINIIANRWKKTEENTFTIFCKTKQNRTVGFSIPFPEKT